jgi:hypothetical protein
VRGRTNLLCLGLLVKANRICVSLPWPEDENRSSFRNVLFSSYLESRTLDRALKPCDSECCTPSSEPFRFYQRQHVLLLLPEANVITNTTIQWRFFKACSQERARAKFHGHITLTNPVSASERLHNHWKRLCSAYIMWPTLRKPSAYMSTFQRWHCHKRFHV